MEASVDQRAREASSVRRYPSSSPSRATWSCLTQTWNSSGMLQTTLHPDRAYRQSEIPTFFGETVKFPGQQGEAGLFHQGYFPAAATDVAKVYALPGVVVLSLFLDPVVGQVELAVQVPEDPSSRNPQGRL